MTRTANGKAVEHWPYIDILGLMQQPGVTRPRKKPEGNSQLFSSWRASGY